MAAHETAARVRDALETLKQSSVRDRPLVEVLSLSHQLAETMQLFFGSLDRSVQGEFRYIGDFIHKARDEIAGLRPNDIRNNRIPMAGAELDAIVRDTERATETIMSEAEAVMSLSVADPEAYRAEVEGRMMTIIEACSFQDLTGQRVKKVVAALRHIEERVDKFASALGVNDSDTTESPEERRARELLLNGPAIDGPEVKQSTIDEMFDDAHGDGISQGDIDSLFD
jgi:chemotaxis protein CheZ